MQCFPVQTKNPRYDPGGASEKGQMRVNLVGAGLLTLVLLARLTFFKPILAKKTQRSRAPIHVDSARKG